MRASGIAALLSITVTAAGCDGSGATQPQPQAWKLSSGRTVWPLQVLRSAPDIDPPFLLLAYTTSAGMRDTLVLRDEAHEVWPRFAPLVQREGYSKAVLQANAKNPYFRFSLPFLLWFQIQHRFTFVLNRQSDGTWRMMGDRVPLIVVTDSTARPFGLDTSFPSRFRAGCKFAPLALRPSGATPQCPPRSVLAVPDSGRR
jgi:hypothetical protein